MHAFSSIYWVILQQTNKQDIPDGHPDFQFLLEDSEAFPKKMTYIYKISPAHAGVCFPWQNQNLLVVSDMKRQKLYSELLINGHPWINMMCYHP